MLTLIDSDIVEEIGTIWIGSHGYLVFKKDSLVHRYIAEKSLGRKLKRNEHVHHINYNKLDNRRQNLLICDEKYHKLIHARTDVYNDVFNPNFYGYCSGCKSYKIKNTFPKSRKRWNGIHNLCKECSNSYRLGKYNKPFSWKERMNQQYRRAKKKNLVTCLSKEGNCL